MIRHLLTTLILVNGSLAVTFGIFYQLVMLCLHFGVNPWTAFVVTIGACGGLFYRLRRSAYPQYEPRQPDQLGE